MICKECKREFKHRTGSYCGSCQPLRPTVASVKQRVSLLMSGAVDGTIPDYRTDTGYIRWGRVERDVQAAIDMLEPNAKEAGRKNTMSNAHDPNDPGNSTKYHTGKQCIERGCTKPAGTAWAWSPFWCQEHNAGRPARIQGQLEAMLVKYAKEGQKG